MSRSEKSSTGRRSDTSSKLSEAAAALGGGLAALDKNPAIRAALVARITKAMQNPKIGAMTLHQIAQALETFGED